MNIESESDTCDENDLNHEHSDLFRVNPIKINFQHCTFEW